MSTDTTPARTLYELAAADPERLFSPYCWRVRMALAHKGLQARTVPCRFTEKALIAFAGTDKVPVLVDGERTVFDSWTIAEYLEMTYPGPSLFGGAAAQAVTRLIARWVESELQARMLRMIVFDIFCHIDPRDQDYFRRSRETRLGTRLEELHAARDERRPAFRDALEPLRRMLVDQPFVAGHEPRYADYVVFGAFQWARVISDYPLLASDDPVLVWRERLLDAFDGLARRMPACGQDD
jgi:glutathione S-transferase